MTKHEDTRGALTIPEGWKLVPVMPTDEMLATILSEGEYGVLAANSTDPISASAVLRISGVASRYADMLDAAPAAPIAPQQAEGLTENILTLLRGLVETAPDIPKGCGGYRRLAKGLTRTIEGIDAAIVLLAAPRQPGEVGTEMSMRGESIAATWSHDAGAYARCSYCGRYSDNPHSLAKDSFPCDCGKLHGWSGSFKKPTAESKWSDAK